MDIPSLERDIRSAIANSEETQKHEEHRTSLLNAAQALIHALEPPDVAITNVAIVPGCRFMCVRVAVDLGLFDVLAEKSPETVSELAKQTHSEGLLVLRLLRTLASIGFVTELGEDKFSATAITRMLTRDHVKAGIIHWYDQGLPVLASAPAYFRQNAYHSPSTSKTGPLQFAHNTQLDTYSYWQTLPGVAENFNTFMNGHFAGKRLSWLEWFPAEQEVISGFDSAKSPYLFIDVGGGRGHEANLLKQKFPSAKGRIVVEDLPDVINDVRDIDSSIELQKYNFFEPQPLKGSYAYFLSNILHNWPDEEALTILRNLRTAMIPSYSRLLIADLILPNTNCPERALSLDIGMMYLHSGMQRSEKQWQELIGNAGLRIERFHKPPGEGDGIVVVVRDN